MNAPAKQFPKFGLVVILLITIAFAVCVTAGVQIYLTYSTGAAQNPSHYIVLILGSIIIVGGCAYLLLSRTSPAFVNPREIVTPHWRPKFGLWTMMLLMVVIAVMGTAGFYLQQSLQVNPIDKKQAVPSRIAFILFALIAPMTLLVVASIGRSVFLWFQNPKKSKKREFIEV